jgi:hypothetical protein
VKGVRQMDKGLVIGGSILAGVFVGCAACIIVKKCPQIGKNISKKTSAIASEAKRAFEEGFSKAQTKPATA